MVFDGTVDGDPSAAIDGIVTAGADLVWVAVDPPALISLMSGAAARGVEAQWSGTTTSYSADLLGTEIAPLLDLYYVASSRTAPWGWQAPGMSHLVDAMTAAQPDLPVSDGYVVGWTQAVLANAILERAAERGDLTRAGIVAAAAEVTTDFGGLAPDQTWAGPPADAAVRATYLADVTLDGYNPGALGEGRGSTGSTPLAGPYVSDVAATPAAATACFG